MPYFLPKLGKMLQKLPSAAVVIGALRKRVVGILQIGELKDELSSIHAKYNFMCEKMSSANQRLYNTNMQRMISEEEISKSCTYLHMGLDERKHDFVVCEQ